MLRFLGPLLVLTLLLLCPDLVLAQARSTVVVTVPQPLRAASVTATVTDMGGAAVLAGRYTLMANPGGASWQWTGMVGGRTVKLILSVQPEQVYLFTILTIIPAGDALVWEQRTSRPGSYTLPGLPLNLPLNIPFDGTGTKVNPVANGALKVQVN